MTDRWFFASTARGLEPLLREELEALGAKALREDRGGVSFRGPRSLGYAACLWSRVATRVFEELQRGRIHHVDDLYTVAKRVDWSKVLTNDHTFAVRARVSGPVVRDARYASLKVKDAIVDQFRDHTGVRPDVDTESPDLPVRVTVKGKVATISRDLAGESLHKRGYRPAQHISPLNEALAAGLLLLSDWDRTTPVCDPMCGSGTFLIEALFILGDRAPGLARRFAFERFPDFDAKAWNTLKAEADARWKAKRADLPVLLGNDVHPAALALTRKAAGRAEVHHLLELHEGDIADFDPGRPVHFVVTNPPYGARLGEGDDLEASWAGLGRWLKAHVGGGTAWILCGEPTLARNLRLKTSRKIPMWNGPIETRWLRYGVNVGRTVREDSGRRASTSASDSTA